MKSCFGWVSFLYNELKVVNDFCKGIAIGTDIAGLVISISGLVLNKFQSQCNNELKELINQID